MSTRNALDISVFAHKITQGTNFSGTFHVIPSIANAISELSLVSLTISTGAVADNRRLRLVLEEGVFFFTIAYSQVLQPESTTRTYIIGQHGHATPSGSTDEIIYIPLPSIPMALETHQYRLILDDGHVDAWSSIGYCQKFWTYEQ